MMSCHNLDFQFTQNDMNLFFADCADIEVDLPENGEPVCFKQIRLVLAAEGDPDCPGQICNYVIEIGDPAQYELKTPSVQQSGVKILTSNDFCIDANDDTVQVSIDFDPATALSRATGVAARKVLSKGWLLYRLITLAAFAMNSQRPPW
jgi:hypothetical protein